MKVVMKNGFEKRMILYRLVMDDSDPKLDFVLDTGFCNSCEAGDERVLGEVEFEDPGLLVYDCSGSKSCAFLNCDDLLRKLASQSSPVSGWWLETAHDVCFPRRMCSLKDYIINKACEYRIISDEDAFKAGIRYERRVISDIPYRWGDAYARWLAVYSHSGQYLYSVSRESPWRLDVVRNGEIIAYNLELHIREVH